MKRLSLVLMSVALVLGMAQCKKNVEPIATGTTSGTMSITLDVDGGSKVSVTPSTGVVSFQTGDKIYVASNGSYVGTLEHNGTNFTGTIDGATSGSPLYFYFVGNRTPSATPTTSMAISIFDQTEELPVISAAPSNENFSTSTYTYTATLLNKCALVKFDVTTSSSAPIIITGVNDVVTVTFSSDGVGTFVSSQSKGAIKMAKDGNDEYWAILAGDQGDVAADGVAYSADLMYNGTCGAISGISNNGYLDGGISVTVSTALEGFSVASGTKVHFAPGNLQYLGTGTSGSLTPKWRFADNQYDYMGNGSNGNVKISGYSTYNTGSNNATPTDADKQAARDLFGWGTSGGGDPETPPYMTVNSNGSIYGGTSDIAGTDKDWGVYIGSSITNGYGITGWRTLTNAEHGYLFNTRTGCSTINGVANAKFSKATVAGVFGVMIFPDSFTWPEGVSAPTANAINQTGNYTAGSYDAAAWTQLQAAGAVFLPAAGNRYGSSVGNAGSNGYYWSSSIVSSYTNSAYDVYFYSGSFSPQYDNNRCSGNSVRLVF